MAAALQTSAAIDGDAEDMQADLVTSQRNVFEARADIDGRRALQLFEASKIPGALQLFEASKIPALSALRA